MKVILKYELKREKNQVIVLPLKHDVLRCDVQNGCLFVWVMSDVDQSDTAIVPFYIFGTGHQVPGDINEISLYCNTVFDNEFVWHVFYGAKGNK